MALCSLFVAGVFFALLSIISVNSMSLTAHQYTAYRAVHFFQGATTDLPQFDKLLQDNIDAVLAGAIMNDWAYLIVDYPQSFGLEQVNLNPPPPLTPSGYVSWVLENVINDLSGGDHWIWFYSVALRYLNEKYGLDPNKWKRSTQRFVAFVFGGMIAHYITDEYCGCCGESSTHWLWPGGLALDSAVAGADIGWAEMAAEGIIWSELYNDYPNGSFPGAISWYIPLADMANIYTYIAMNAETKYLSTPPITSLAALWQYTNTNFQSLILGAMEYYYLFSQVFKAIGPAVTYLSYYPADYDSTDQVEPDPFAAYVPWEVDNLITFYTGGTDMAAIFADFKYKQFATWIMTGNYMFFSPPTAPPWWPANPPFSMSSLKQMEVQMSSPALKQNQGPRGAPPRMKLAETNVRFPVSFLEELLGPLCIEARFHSVPVYEDNVQVGVQFYLDDPSTVNCTPSFPVSPASPSSMKHSSSLSRVLPSIFSSASQLKKNSLTSWSRNSLPSPPPQPVQNQLNASPQKYEYFGTSLLVMDLDHDGLDDLVIGSPGFSSPDFPQVGGIAIWYGGDPQQEVFIPSSETIDMVQARCGWSLAQADLNKDGLVDLIVGCPSWGFFLDDLINADGVPTYGWPESKFMGEIQVFFGTRSRFTKSKSPDLIIQGDNTLIDSNLGRNIIGGDINGDGYDDIVVAAPYAWNNSEWVWLTDPALDAALLLHGYVGVILARDKWPNHTMHISDIVSWSIRGPQVFAEIGESLALVPASATSPAVLIIGAPYSGISQGAVYGYEMKMANEQLTGSLLFTINGLYQLSAFGTSLAVMKSGCSSYLLVGAATENTTAGLIQAGVLRIYDWKNLHGTFDANENLVNQINGNRAWARFGYQIVTSNSPVAISSPFSVNFTSSLPFVHSEIGFVTVWKSFDRMLETSASESSDTTTFAGPTVAGRFGATLALSTTNRNVLFVGAPKSTVNGVVQAGAVSIQPF